MANKAGGGGLWRDTEPASCRQDSSAAAEPGALSREEGSRGWEWGPVAVRGEGLTSSRELHPSCEPCWLKGWGPLGAFLGWCPEAIESRDPGGRLPAFDSSSVT